MRECDGDPDNGFILIRVFHVDSEDPGIKWFPNPWKLYLARALDLRSVEGYQVTTADAPEG